MAAVKWRDEAAPIIAATIVEVTGKLRPPFSEDEQMRIRRVLRDRYPFGERSMWPYKVWCDEVRRQLGERSSAKCSDVAPGQQKLFG